MAETDLTPEEAASDARLPLYNTGAYDPATNEYGFDEDGHQVNQMRQARDAGVMGRLARRLALFTQGLANTVAANVLLTAEDASNTALDRIATVQNVGLAADEVVKAAEQAQKLVGTSTTSVTPAVASRTFTTQPGKYFAVGTFLTIASTAAPTTRWMTGQVTAYNATTGALTVNVEAIGSVVTSASSWSIYLGGPRGPQGGQGIPGVVTMPRQARTSNTQIVAGDSGTLFDCTGTFTQTFAAPATIGADRYFLIDNSGTGTITLSGVTGVAAVIPGALVLIQCDGSTLRSYILNASGKGQANGFAELDTDGRIPTQQSRALGDGQTWQTFNRSPNTSFQNTTGRAIAVTAAGPTNGVSVQVSLDNASFMDVANALSSGYAGPVIIPINYYYRFSADRSVNVRELR